MQFNIYFDIASIVLLIVLMWRFFFFRHFPSRSNRSFWKVLVFGILTIVLDVLGCILLNYLDALPLSLIYAVNVLYFAFQLALPSALTLYAIALAAKGRNIPSRNYVIACTPAFLFEILLFATLRSGGVFSISAESGYIRGPFSFITYASFVTYMVLCIYSLFRFKSRLSSQVRFAFITMMIPVSLAVIAQVLFPDVMLTGFALTIAAYIMYMVIQNPEQMIDAVSNAYNYNAFLEIARDMMSGRGHTRVVVIDVHGLRRVNTLYGTSEGDNLLRTISEYFGAGRKNWFFRISDTRFAMLTRDKNSYLSFLGKAVEVKTSEWDLTNGKKASITLGICNIKHAEFLETVENLVNVIDRVTLEQSRDPEGKLVYEVDHRMRDILMKKNIIESGLRGSLESGEGFFMNYQMIYSCEDQKFVSCEALLRFDCPDLGVISPGDFLPIAEECGLLDKLDDRVIKTVFRDIGTGKLQALGLGRIHINLSAAVFFSPDTRDKLLALTKEMNIDPEMISFEVTENIISSASRDMDKVMKSIQECGYSFSMDDFGTGYSNLSRLLDLPFDVVKLDRSLLLGSKDVYREIVKIAKHLNLRVIAEGAETKEQADFIASCGADAIQGYYYSVPKKLSEL